MQQVVGGDGILHDTEVGWTFEQVLALPAGVLGADLLAVDALNGQTLWFPSQIIIHRHGTISSYLVFLLSPELDKGGMYIIQRWRGETRSRRGRRGGFRLGLGSRPRALLGGSPRGRPGASGRGRAGCGQGTPAGHIRQRGLHRCGMGVDPVRHHGTVRGRQGTSRTRPGGRRGGRRPVGSGRVTIGSADTVGRGLGGLGLRLRSTGMTAETGALEQMLFLARGILCADLLAVDALDRETL